MTYPFEWGAATDIGRVRDRNEDAFVVDPALGLLLVLDGLGGHAGGDVAARTAARDLPAGVAGQFELMRTRGPKAIRQRLGRIIAERNGQLYLRALTQRGCEGMGATAALLLLMGGRAYVANLGDSRVYRLRRGRLVQMSLDHSVVRELIEQGRIEPAEALNHQARGLVTQYLGMPGEAQPYVRSCALKPGDQFLLCSDGLTDQVADAGIRELLEAHPDCQVACDVLVEMANAHGGHDNVTVVLARWTGESPQGS